MLQCVAVFGSMLQCVEVFGSVLQCVAVFGSVFQCVAVLVTLENFFFFEFCNTLAGAC